MASKVRWILFAIGLFFLSVGLAWLAFSEKKKNGKPEAGSHEQMAEAREAKEIKKLAEEADEVEEINKEFAEMEIEQIEQIEQEFKKSENLEITEDGKIKKIDDSNKE